MTIKLRESEVWRADEGLVVVAVIVSGVVGSLPAVAIFSMLSPLHRWVSQTQRVPFISGLAFFPILCLYNRGIR